MSYNLPIAFEKFQVNLLNILLILLPLAVWMKLGDPSSSLKILILRIGTAAFFLHFIIRGYIPLPPKKIVFYSALFILATVIPVFYSGNYLISFIGIYPFYSSSVMTALCMVVFFLYSLSISRDNIKNIFVCLVFSSFLISAYGILQYFGIDFLSWKGEFYPRIWATMGNPNFLAAYIAVILPLTMSLYIKEGKWFFGVSCIISSIALILTVSRGGILAAVVGVLYLLVHMRNEKDFFRNLRKLLLLLILVYAGFFVFKPGVIKNFSDRINVKETNVSSRISQWKTALQMFTEKPVFGWGINGYYMNFRKYMNREFLDYTGSLSVPGYPHNYMLKILVNGGIVFSGFILLWWLGIFFAVNKYSKKDHLNAAVCASCIVLAVQSMFSFNVVAVSVPIWVLLGISIPVKYMKFSDSKLRFMLILPVCWLIVFSLSRLYGDYLCYHGEYKLASEKAPEVPKFGMFYGKKVFIEAKYSEAKEVFRNEIKKMPFNALAYNGLGSVLLAENKLEKAEQYFKEALLRDPYLIDSHMKLAKIYKKRKDYKNLEFHYLVVLDINPALINARYDLGVIYYRTGRLKEAVVQWGNVLKYDPNHKLAGKSIFEASKN